MVVSGVAELVAWTSFSRRSESVHMERADRPTRQAEPRRPAVDAAPPLRSAVSQASEKCHSVGCLTGARNAARSVSSLTGACFSFPALKEIRHADSARDTPHDLTTLKQRYSFCRIYSPAACFSLSLHFSAGSRLPEVMAGDFHQLL